MPTDKLPGTAARLTCFAIECPYCKCPVESPANDGTGIIWLAGAKGQDSDEVVCSECQRTFLIPEEFKNAHQEVLIEIAVHDAISYTVSSILDERM